MRPKFNVSAALKKQVNVENNIIPITENSVSNFYADISIPEFKEDGAMMNKNICEPNIERNQSCLNSNSASELIINCKESLSQCYAAVLEEHSNEKSEQKVLSNVISSEDTFLKPPGKCTGLNETNVSQTKVTSEFLQKSSGNKKLLKKKSFNLGKAVSKTKTLYNYSMLTDLPESELSFVDSIVDSTISGSEINLNEDIEKQMELDEVNILSSNDDILKLSSRDEEFIVASEEVTSNTTFSKKNRKFNVSNAVSKTKMSSSQFEMMAEIPESESNFVGPIIDTTTVVSEVHTNEGSDLQNTLDELDKLSSNEYILKSSPSSELDIRDEGFTDASKVVINDISRKSTISSVSTKNKKFNVSKAISKTKISSSQFEMMADIPESESNFVGPIIDTTAVVSEVRLNEGSDQQNTLDELDRLSSNEYILKSSPSTELDIRDEGFTDASKVVTNDISRKSTNTSVKTKNKKFNVSKAISKTKISSSQFAIMAEIPESESNFVGPIIDTTAVVSEVHRNEGSGLQNTLDELDRLSSNEDILKSSPSSELDIRDEGFTDASKVVTNDITRKSTISSVSTKNKKFNVSKAISKTKILSSQFAIMADITETESNFVGPSADTTTVVSEVHTKEGSELKNTLDESDRLSSNEDILKSSPSSELDIRDEGFSDASKVVTNNINHKSTNSSVSPNNKSASKTKITDLPVHSTSINDEDDYNENVNHVIRNDLSSENILESSPISESDSREQTLKISSSQFAVTTGQPELITEDLNNDVNDIMKSSPVVHVMPVNDCEKDKNPVQARVSKKGLSSQKFNIKKAISKEHAFDTTLVNAIDNRSDAGTSFPQSRKKPRPYALKNIGAMAHDDTIDRSKLSLMDLFNVSAKEPAPKGRIERMNKKLKEKKEALEANKNSTSCAETILAESQVDEESPCLFRVDVDGNMVPCITKGAATPMFSEDMEVVVEDATALNSTYHSFTKRKLSGKKWTEIETKNFYMALSVAGTNFYLMETIFEGRTRNDLKKKFKVEEKKKPEHVKYALLNPQPRDLLSLKFNSHIKQVKPRKDAVKKRIRCSESDSEESIECMPVRKRRKFSLDSIENGVNLEVASQIT